jgi:hypothetical protein
MSSLEKKNKFLVLIDSNDELCYVVSPETIVPAIYATFDAEDDLLVSTPAQFIVDYKVACVETNEKVDEDDIFETKYGLLYTIPVHDVKIIKKTCLTNILVGGEEKNFYDSIVSKIREDKKKQIRNGSNDYTEDDIENDCDPYECSDVDFKDVLGLKIDEKKFDKIFNNQ